MIYELRLLATESATGYFGCIPKMDLHYEGCLAYARRHPNDEFMRRHLLRLIQQREESELKEIVAGIDPDDRFLRALLWEACQARPGRWKSRGSFSPKELNALTAQTPLLDLKAHLLRDRGLHRKWIALFRANICEHRPLPDPAAMGWSGPFSDARVKNLLEPRVTLKQLGEAPRPLAAEAGPPELGPEQVHALALERLRQAGVAVGAEMRHISSLSPIALLRRWQMNTAICSGRHDFALSGELTAYGRGIDLEAARAACVMEVVERCSSFASFDSRGLSGYAAPARVLQGTTPFEHSLCFEIETANDRLAALLNSYRSNGIHIQFQDLTPSMGLPCCKCFVVTGDGKIAKGTGAHLDARRALLAALTETPFPYPGGPPTQPAMEGLVRVPVEALPNYSSGSPEQDLRTLETLLLANGFRLIYADLTRKDLGLPVVRAIVPGMEILADFDRHSRVHPRLYANYLKLTAKT